MKIKHILVALTSVLLYQTGLKAQEEIVYDQYYYNYYLVNPAVAGAERCTHFMLTGKFQWRGQDDAPLTQTLSFRTRLRNGLDKLGIGAYIYNDKNGNSYRQGGQVSLAYHIPLSGGGTSNYMMKERSVARQLSFGLSAVVSHYSFAADLWSQNTNDNVINNGDRNKGYYFNANAGVYFLWDDFFAGVSAANLVPTKLTELGENEPIRDMNFFIFTGYDFQLGNGMTFEPGAMFKFDVPRDENAVADSVDVYGSKQLDLHVKFMQNVNDDFGYWLELLYRHSLDHDNGQPLSIAPMGGVRIKKFNIGYTFTLGLTDFNRHNYGTHEVMLAYSFCKTQHFCR